MPFLAASTPDWLRRGVLGARVALGGAALYLSYHLTVPAVACVAYLLVGTQLAKRQIAHKENRVPASTSRVAAAADAAFAVAMAALSPYLGLPACAFVLLLFSLRQLEHEARRDERDRLATDFHDGPLQVFAGLQMGLHTARHAAARNPADAAPEFDRLHHLAERQTEELRSYLAELRSESGPAVLDVDDAMDKVVANFEGESRIRVTIRKRLGRERAGPHAVALVRMFREALHNVQKHAGASEVEAAIECAGSQLVLTVSDNGKGFALEGNYSHDDLERLGAGPRSIMRRARGAGGEVTLRSEAGKGTTLVMRMPR